MQLDQEPNQNLELTNNGFVIMPSPTKKKKLKNLCKRDQRKAQNLQCFFIDYLPFPLQQMSAGNCKWHHHHHQQHDDHVPQ
jgi:hypothetical protein